MEPEETKPPQQKGAPIDWTTALKLYLTPKESGNLRTLEEVASELNINYDTVKNKAAVDKWTAQRNDLQTKILEEFKQNQIEERGRAEQRHLGIWRSLQNTSLRLLKTISQKIEAAETNERSLSLALNNVSSALDRAISGERIALGLPNTIAKSEVTERKVELSQETIQEIDKLFEKNNATAEPSPTN